MTVLNDDPLNNAEFGRYFYGTSSYMGNGLYEMKYTALREGAHKLFVKARHHFFLYKMSTECGQFIEDFIKMSRKIDLYI